MKDRNSLSIFNVSSLTGDICSDYNEGEWESVYVPVNLKNEKGLDGYYSLVCCPKNKLKNYINIFKDEWFSF